MDKVKGWETMIMRRIFKFRRRDDETGQILLQ